MWSKLAYKETDVWEEMGDNIGTGSITLLKVNFIAKGSN